MPLTTPVAGVAMGLILEPDGRFTVLTDILGSEDALGDMDFKVAGSAEAVTAFQMDIKVEGITLDIMQTALQRARDARQHILGEMAKCNPGPKRVLSPYAPKVVKVTIDPSKVHRCRDERLCCLFLFRGGSACEMKNAPKQCWLLVY